MPPSRQRSWAGPGLGPTSTHDLTMTPAVVLTSADNSTPPSPTTTRRIDLERTHSTLSNDERTPLLHSAGRSRIRIQSAVESAAGTVTGKPLLSRHQSINGMAYLVSRTMGD